MASSPPIPEYLRYEEAHEHYRLSVKTWQRLVSAGELPSYKPSERIVLLARADIEAYLERHRRGGALIDDRQAQGLPMTIEDKDALARIAEILAHHSTSERAA